MKRLLSILTASLILSSMLVAPAYAKDKGEKGSSGGAGGLAGGENGNGASPAAGGEDAGKAAAGAASGQAKSGGQKPGARAAKQAAPAAARAAAVAPQLAGVRAGTKVNVVEVNDLINGKRRAALNKSLAANQAGIDQLRSNLVRLRLSGLNARDAGDAIATRREPDGSVTVFVDRGAN